MARGALLQSPVWRGSACVATVQMVSARNRFCLFVLWMTQDCLITELRAGAAVVRWDLDLGADRLGRARMFETKRDLSREQPRCFCSAAILERGCSLTVQLKIVNECEQVYSAR